MASKYYAVKAGKIPGIYRTWDECKAQVHGYSGAIYKSFSIEEEAKAFIKKESGIENTGRNMSEKNNKKDIDSCIFETEPDTVVAYVDGSYNGSEDEFSYGMVILEHGNEHRFSQKIVDKELAAMNNVAGEIKGAEAAMKYALEKGYKKLVIYHDYEGISRWCLGEWKTNRTGTKAYKEFYDSIQGEINIQFVKVAGHSNDKYNDMADELAKQALGISNA